MVESFKKSLMQMKIIFLILKAAKFSQQNYKKLLSHLRMPMAVKYMLV
ncbi:hypothetical protein FBZ81_11664 [Azospirillum brasilense]|nr:hypothetical protein OH82_04547 [Azospirillum brasilense]TWB72976.1 hypothetical protein FBZ81_11664 [Azospirillum brasilense]